MRLKDLDSGALFVGSIHYDWWEHQGCGEEWEHYDITECYECQAPVTAFDGWVCPKCKKDVDPADGPMMNYYYPLPEFDYVLRERFDGSMKKASLAVAKAGPVCIVEVGEQYGLALTGGGMNLSWEICHGFIMAGYLPPLYFHDLPHMSGYNERPLAKLVVAACLKAARVAKRKAAAGVKDVLRLRAWIKEGEMRVKERRALSAPNP